MRSKQRVSQVYTHLVEVCFAGDEGKAIAKSFAISKISPKIKFLQSSRGEFDLSRGFLLIPNFLALICIFTDSIDRLS